MEQLTPNSNAARNAELQGARVRNNPGTQIRNGLRSVDNEIRSISDTIDRVGTGMRIVSDFVRSIIGLIRGEPYKGPSERSGKTPYKSYYGSGQRRNEPDRDLRTLDNFDEVEFLGRGRAERALYELSDLIDRRGYATVLDLYDQAKIANRCPPTYESYGWTDIDDTHPMKTTYDDRYQEYWYVLDLPAARFLGNKR